MFLAEINWWGVLAAFAVYFIVGAIWFGPKTFFPVWARAKGIDPAAPVGKYPPAVIFAAFAVGAFVQVTALASVLWFVASAQDAAVGAAGGALGGLLVGVAFAAASSLSHRLFGSETFRTWLIEVGSDVVGLTLAGLVLGLIG